MALWDNLKREAVDADEIAAEMPASAKAVVWATKDELQHTVAERESGATVFGHRITSFILERPRAFYPVELSANAAVAMDNGGKELDKSPTQSWVNIERVQREAVHESFSTPTKIEILREVANFALMDVGENWTVAAAAGGGEKYARAGTEGNVFVNGQIDSKDFRGTADISEMIAYIPNPYGISVEELRISPERLAGNYVSTASAEHHGSPKFSAEHSKLEDMSATLNESKETVANPPIPIGGPFGYRSKDGEDDDDDDGESLNDRIASAAAVQEVDLWEDEPGLCATVRTFEGETFDFEGITGVEASEMMDDPTGKMPEDVIPDSLRDDEPKKSVEEWKGLYNTVGVDTKYKSHVEFDNGSRMATGKGLVSGGKLSAARDPPMFAPASVSISAEDLKTDAMDAIRTSLHELAEKEYSASFDISLSEEQAEKLKDKLFIPSDSDSSDADGGE